LHSREGVGQKYRKTVKQKERQANIQKESNKCYINIYRMKNMRKYIPRKKETCKVKIETNRKQLLIIEELKKVTFQ
jgi:hypothetical protein